MPKSVVARLAPVDLKGESNGTSRMYGEHNGMHLAHLHSKKERGRVSEPRHVIIVEPSSPFHFYTSTSSLLTVRGFTWFSFLFCFGFCFLHSLPANPTSTTVPSSSASPTPKQREGGRISCDNNKFLCYCLWLRCLLGHCCCCYCCCCRFGCTDVCLIRKYVCEYMYLLHARVSHTLPAIWFLCLCTKARRARQTIKQTHDIG